MSAVKTIFMFSGQGSQYRRMGQQLFEADPTFRDWMLRLDRMAHDLSGKRVLDEIYSGSKADIFDRTLLTHPAIFMVEYSLAQCLIEQGLTPDIALGASLGTFAATVVSGHLSVEDAMRAVVAQAQALEASCERGGMLAILSNPSLYEEPFLRERSEMAGVNFPNHFAVSCAQQHLVDIETELKRREITFQRLDVSYAFHSRLIDPAEQGFSASLHQIRFASSAGVYACSARADTFTSLQREDFWRAVRHPIRFFDTIGRLEQTGPYRYIDVGPSGTLATFVKYALPKTSASTSHTILTPYGQDHKNLANVLSLRNSATA